MKKPDPQEIHYGLIQQKNGAWKPEFRKKLEEAQVILHETKIFLPETKMVILSEKEFNLLLKNAGKDTFCPKETYTTEAVLACRTQSQKKDATHGVCVYLGKGSFGKGAYFILAMDTPEKTKEPLGDRFRWKFLRKGLPTTKCRLHTFVIKGEKTRKLLKENLGKKIESKTAVKCIPKKIRNLEYLRAKIDGGQMWLVDYESRPEVIRISPSGSGFFAPGQDMHWGLSAVKEWVKEIKPTPPKMPKGGLSVKYRPL